MCSWFNRNLITISALPVYFSILLFCTPLFAGYDLTIKQVNLLEDNFKTLSADFYKVSSSLAEKRLTTIDDIDQLYAEVNRLVDNQQSTTAIQLLFLNVDTVKANLEHHVVFKLTELLLEKNEWHYANRLFRNIKDEGDQALLAEIQFIFAKYHAERLEWPQVHKLLNDVTEQLSAKNAAYANLLNGSALQHLKKHRLAIESYKKVPASSPYYAYAQLNIAIADFRQGWLTDAQSIINDLIKHADKDNSDELTNRLYLVLGYALLQKEYYRDARDAFRHIGLDSRYTNRALLGIGLTATSQGDFVAGLNALSILKDKKTFDLSVDESYLLVPYVYEKLQQELTVTA
ncbi:MAG: tetratricopeptide repeat protein, partial [Gammaproteobacteria bacterium]